MEGHPIFSEKILMIPDYVLPRDVPAIYNYFKTFNIADILSVEYRDHEEEEYWVEDKPFYGYALIEVNNWYNNTGAVNFYKSIFDKKCKMVYDDPFYWELTFYNNFVRSFNSPNNIENDYFNLEQENSPEELNNEHQHEHEHVDDDDYDDNYEEYYSGDEKDDVKDENYEYCDTDDEEDKPYEYEYLYSKFDKKVTLKKKPKTNNDNNDKKITELLTSKNYMKRNKRKDFKNVWVRRLRQKTN
jgi:hypothetical protein